MRDEVQWKIKRSDARDRAERIAPHDAPASGGKLLPIEGKIFAVDTRSLFGGNVEDKDGAVHFNARQLDGLASLLDYGLGEFFSALGDGYGHAAKHALPFEGRQTTSSTESLD